MANTNTAPSVAPAAKKTTNGKAKLITTTIADDFSTISIDVAGAGAFVLAVADLASAITSEAITHGLKQKLVDAAAIPAADLPADPAAAAMTKYNAILAVRDNLLSGVWSKRAGDGTGPVAGITAIAFAGWINGLQIAAKKPELSPDDMAEKYAAMIAKMGSYQKIAALPAVAAIIERIKSERAAKGPVIDTDALLADLGL